MLLCSRCECEIGGKRELAIHQTTCTAPLNGKVVAPLTEAPPISIFTEEAGEGDPIRVPGGLSYSVTGEYNAERNVFVYTVYRTVGLMAHILGQVVRSTRVGADFPPIVIKYSRSRSILIIE